MRLNPDDIHPKVWKALDEYETSMGLMAGDAKMAQVFANHQNEWWKTYGKSFMLWTALWFAMMVAAVVTAKQTDFDFLIPIVFLAGAGGAVGGYLRNRRSATVAELVALLPGLNLDEMGKLYLETLIATYQQDLPEDAAKETVAQLKDLMNESIKLSEWQTSLRDAIAIADVSDVNRDVEELERRLASTKDETARKTLEESLAMARTRLETSSRYLPYLERIEAQQALVRQSFLRLKSDLMRAKIAPNTFLSMEVEGLRQSTLQIRNHADEIERAVLELSGSA